MTNAELRAREYLMHREANAFKTILKHVIHGFVPEPAGALEIPADFTAAIQAAIDDDRRNGERAP
jgi:hypothetical protein